MKSSPKNLFLIAIFSFLCIQESEAKSIYVLDKPVLSEKKDLICVCRNNEKPDQCLLRLTKECKSN